MDKLRNLIRKELKEIEPGKPSLISLPLLSEPSRLLDQKKLNDLKNKFKLQYDALKYIYENVLDANLAVGTVMEALTKGEDGIEEVNKLINEIELLKSKTILMLDSLDYIKRKME